MLNYKKVVHNNKCFPKFCLHLQDPIFSKPLSYCFQQEDIKYLAAINKIEISSFSEW